MDDELRMLHEAMTIKERLKLLAELQHSYLDELVQRGLESGIAEQLMMEWSRHAYPMTFRAVGDPGSEFSLDELLGASERFDDAPADGAQPPAPPSNSDDPSSVPPGEPWLQLVQDVDSSDDEDSGADAEADAGDQRAA